MPKLLQINVDSALFSCGKICEDIAKVAQQHGWETFVAYGREHKEGVNKEIKVGNKLYVYEHYLENKLIDNEGLASRCPSHKLISRIKSLCPDVIHIHGIHDHWLNYKILFRYLATLSIPIIWTQHDCWAFTGGCMYPDAHRCNQWKTKCIECNHRRAWLFHQTQKQFDLKRELFLSVRNLTLVPVSDWMGGLLQNSFLKDNKKITIHNGINIDVFKPFNNKDQLKTTIIGVASTWDLRKGLGDFIKLRHLLEINDYEFILVGLSKKQISDLPFGIRGIERTHNPEELAKLYSHAHVFVNPTYSDNFPTTNIEALACGTPVITYKTGGSVESVEEAVKLNVDDIKYQDKICCYTTGMVVEQGNVVALSEAIRYIKDHPIDPETCRKRAIDNFDKERCFLKYIELYDRLHNGRVNF